MSPKVIGLLRVSSDHQDVESQRHAIAYWARVQDVEVEVIEEVRIDRNGQRKNVSGAALSRPVLEGVVKRLKDGDTLVVYALDRIARDVVRLILTLEALCARGVKVVSLREPYVDLVSPMRRVNIAMLGVFAEMQRANIRACTMAAVVREKGKPTRSVHGRRWGRPQKKFPQMAEALARVKAGETPWKVARSLGIPETTFRNRLSKLGLGDPPSPLPGTISSMVSPGASADTTESSQAGAPSETPVPE